MIEAHRGPGWDKAEAYLPPCSGGKGHGYCVTIKTLTGDKVTAETVVEVGKHQSIHLSIKSMLNNELKER